MNQLEHMMDRIREDQSVPERVWKKLDIALCDLPDYEDGSGKKRSRKKFASAAAAIAVVGVTLCISNPALAAKIPLLGKIFEEVENNIPFSGDYSEKAGILAQATGEEREGDPLASPGIVKSDAGITVTASEVYCDGLSVFLTAQIEVDQGGLHNLPAHYIDGGDSTAEMLYLRGEWNLSDDSEAQDLFNDNLEGKVIDDHTFVGMLKLDLEDYNRTEGELSLRLSSIGWDDVTMLDAEDISESHRTEGQWEFDIPFTVDTEAVREIAVGKEGNGYTLEKVIVSPYQVVAYVDVPFTEREVTREEYESVMAEKTGAKEDPGITYEEYAEQAGKTYQFWNAVICDQDGEMLFSNPEGDGKAVAAVDGKELSKLYIFVFDDMEKDLEVEKSSSESGSIDIQKAGADAAVTSEVTIQ